MRKQRSSPAPGDKPTPTAPPPPPPWRFWLWPLALLATFVLYIFLFNSSIMSPSTVSLTYSQFQTDVRQHQVKSVDIGSSSSGQNRSITGTLKNGSKFTTTGPGDGTSLQGQLAASGVSTTYSQQSSGVGSTLLTLRMIFAPGFGVVWLIRRMVLVAAVRARGRESGGRASSWWTRWTRSASAGRVQGRWSRTTSASRH